MKKLSKKIVVIALLLGSLGIYSCKKEVGPKGDPGADGNANVTQINFGNTSIPASGRLILTLPGITKSIADKSVILIYGKQLLNGSPWFSMSGYWYDVTGNTEYRTHIIAQDPLCRIIIDRISGAFDQIFDAIRVIVIPANVFVNGRSANPPFDINDYDSVRQYFNLSN